MLLWNRKMGWSGAINFLKEGLMFTTNKGAVGNFWSLMTFFRKLKEKFAQINVTIRELHHIIPEVPKTTIHEAVTENLRYRKLCTRWVPKKLTITKRNRWVPRWSFLRATCYVQEGDEFLDSNVTGDETRVFQNTPESKQHSLLWCHIHAPRNKNINTSISGKKIMASVFCDRKGILLVDFMPPGATINAAAYCDTLTWLRWAIQNKRRGMLSHGMYLLHDNACPHSAHVTTALLEKFKWDKLDHPPYSPDLVPSNFHLFLHLKKHLARKKFNDDDEVQEVVMMWFKGQANAEAGSKT